MAESPAPGQTAAESQRRLAQIIEACSTVPCTGVVQRDDPMFWYTQFRKDIVEVDTGDSDGTGDDMLFFVKEKDPVTLMKKDAKEEYFVKRRNREQPPLFEQVINWQKTYLLNMLTHQLVFTITVLVCHNDTEDPRQQYRVLRRVQKQVYSSPQKLRLDQKAQQAEPAFPLIHFAIADFDGAWKDVVISAPGHFVAVDLSISGRAFGMPLAAKHSVFRGGLGYKTITKAYSERGKQWWWMGQRPPSALSSLLPPALRPRDEQFLDIRGPGGKGRVQMAFAPASDESGSPAAAGVHPALMCMLTYVCMPYEVLVSDVFRSLEAQARQTSPMASPPVTPAVAASSPSVSSSAPESPKPKSESPAAPATPSS